MFGTEKVICPKNSEGWMVRVWDGLNLDRSKLFGSLCSNPNKIQTNDMVGGVFVFEFYHTVMIWLVVFVFICGCCAHRVLTHHDVLILRSVDVFLCMCVFLRCLFVVFYVIVVVMKCSDTSWCSDCASGWRQEVATGRRRRRIQPWHLSGTEKNSLPPCA